MLTFHVKFVKTDGWTKVKQYAPNLYMGGHKKSLPTAWGDLKILLHVIKLKIYKLIQQLVYSKKISHHHL